MKCWWTMPTPAWIARGGIAEDALLAVDEDLARVRLVQAGQDVHQRRLAGAVLAQQAEHLAPVGRDRDPVVGEDARKPLRDVAQFEPHRAGPRRGVIPPPVRVAGRGRSLWL